ncbi:MAG: hypothetical protein RLZZ618_4159 [Pseudomonadota bacterium]
MLTDVTTVMDQTGREHLVVITKAAWLVPEAGTRARPVTPSPIETGDVYAGEPGLSAMLYGSDYLRFKSRCDILFNASAYGPNGEPVTETTASWQVGPLKKAVRVVGHRSWKRTLGFAGLTDPQPFDRMPLHYGLAFGGTRTYEEGRGDNRQVFTEALLTNPAGRGWAGSKTLDGIEGMPAPCLEPLNERVRRPDAKVAPVAFSAIGRHWLPRRDHAGTYDDHWRKQVFPFMPEDFDEQFNQCAPLDQQMTYPRGGEAVVLRNMLPGRPEVQFQLPRMNHVKVRVLRKDLSTEEPAVNADTLYFELDAEDGPRFSVIWRASVPIQRRIHEFGTVAVGPVNSQWWREKVLGLGEGGCSGCGADLPDLQAVAA